MLEIFCFLHVFLGGGAIALDSQHEVHDATDFVRK